MTKTRSPTIDGGTVEVVSGQWMLVRNLDGCFLVRAGTLIQSCPFCAARVVRVSREAARGAGLVTVDEPSPFSFPASYGVRHRCKI